mgnify:CR=1 FL=1
MNYITNESPHATNHFSRYAGITEVTNLNDKIRGTSEYKRHLVMKTHLKKTDEFSIYTVEKGDTWDSIALKFYNNPTYYWIICDYNRIHNCMIEPKVGEIIEIPTLGKYLEFETYA